MASYLSLRFGPSGFEHKDWAGEAYPPGLSGWRTLEVLARNFDSVELNSTFRTPLQPGAARLFCHAVRGNPRFRFTALLGRAFTYDRDLTRAEEWRQGLRPLERAGRFGALVLQFPWAFRYTEENRDFLIRLRREFAEFPLAAEFRHESWSRDEALGTLIDYRLGLVNIDQPVYARAMPPTSLLTFSVAYVRLHGRAHRAAFQEFREMEAEPYRYRAEELDEWRPRIERLATHAQNCFVVATNSARADSLANLGYLARKTEGIGQGRAVRPALAASAAA
jgi:uncharacterized protein YecE (DUF72 family)